MKPIIEHTLPTIEHTQGDVFDLPLEFHEPDGSGPLNLTGKTVFLTVKRQPDADASDAGAILKKDIAAHTNAAGGMTTPSIAKADTVAAPAGRWVYELKVAATADSSNPLTLGTGIWIIKSKFTNRA